ncbi:hypothetical protein SAMN06296036_1124 [Pseudobacteriovorax antillogorgiicola]|uniref:Uncharacterized protein n=1 Tax=Pseudobacteriovorax antillogorgiicola TaxID=1513793 RepID=A0A1Y6C0Q7_9BACT|nr:hypothetical protein EDD56_1125 [Pseudobacteriovorax antillogorgiicola]SMF39428.1 hypothetical protein SAMN06296036_1124 [Pseudobacteriovorax antillogorgiicola]
MIFYREADLVLWHGKLKEENYFIKQMPSSI